MIFFFLLAILALSIALDTMRLGISPMPSSRRTRDLLLAKVGKGDVYELGSGWGGLAIALAKTNRVYAYELASVPWFVSLLQKRFRKAKNLSLRRKDFFSEDLTRADILFCYLYPKAMQKLALKFEKELKKGAIVYSNTFQIPGKKPDEVIEVRDLWNTKIYCYKF